MSKISPADKLFDDLIPDSPEYWQAIENIDYEAKPKRGVFWHWIKNCFVCENDTTSKVEEATFVLATLKDIANRLSCSYPSCKFVTSWNSEFLEIRSKENNFTAQFSVTQISIKDYAYWQQEDYEDFLAKVKRAVYLIEQKQKSPSNDARMRSIANDIEAGRRRL